MSNNPALDLPFFELLKKYSINPRKNLGQNFLHDPNIANNIASLVKTNENTVIIEIGAGMGSLTRPLLNLLCKKIIAVEYDPKCIKYLRDLEAEHPDKLIVLEADAMELHTTKMLESYGGGNKLSIVSNLPYNISVPLLMHWMDDIESFDSMTLMFQKEVATRIVAKPNNKDYGAVSVAVQFLCDVNKCFDVSPSVFFPKPQVSSTVIHIKPKILTAHALKKYQKLKFLVKELFKYRRKTIQNCLKKVIPDADLILKECNIDVTKRPEALTIDDFKKLVERVYFSA